MAQATASKGRGQKKKTTPGPMKGIRPCGDGRWKVEVMVQGLRTSKTVASIEEAVPLRKALLEQLEARAAGQEEAKKNPRTHTLTEAVDKTFRLVWRGTADEDRQKIRVAHLEQFFGVDCPLKDITAERILDFREWAEAVLKNCPNTINKKVMSLSRILRTAHELGWLEARPKIHLARVRNSRLRFMLPEEEELTLAAFQALTNQDYVDAFLVLLYTGFRLSELWTLTAANVNPTNGTVSLWNGETKNGQGRTIPMTEKVKEILLRRREQFPSGPLWPGLRNHQFQHQWDKVRLALGKADDPEWVTHMLRHTCCTRLVQAGVNLFLVQQWMGHKSLSITQRYAHLAPQHMQHAGDALEAFTSRAAGAA